MTRAPGSHHEMVTFYTIVQAGSFAQAAAKLGQTPSAISKTVGRLEARLNVKLFNRSTRSIRTTEVGEQYYHYCEQILSDIKRAEENIAQFSSQYSGEIQVNCGAGFALHHVVNLISEFLVSYPNISIHLSTSATSNFFEDSVDISFEFNSPQDSSLVARKIGACPWTICAAPSYIDKFGMPESPMDLKQHNCCVMVGEQVYDNWRFKDGDRNYNVRIDGNFHAAAFLVLKALLNGVGIAQLPHYLVAEHIESGDLIPLFSDLRPNVKREVYIAYPHRAQTKKVRAFIDFAIKYLSEIAL